ncbi:MAG TPA: M14-type cytosolic carboxypeptidase [Zoogloea sp.]|uniref:M14 family metallopeptidase n=3 Tax=Zoogloea sp. TaxID=49181 RepID=UPI002C8D225A|nr:M14-type cytosolic carboxypeptidase [Zoogloea sp.]HMV18060.1 M14-type cytosolic carboxypeptidase [Rhodocyclaceae bacterium]HMV64868.1 M14-type cytosolic carboxypeptidase [Rhodocyclaceae bacterium]HMW52234.1 M14-type cytosolic carboxypeptidase [Rhodocyclaceae bacterium]HMY51097.1 M14-type cytosolic carboxypeptidase [Rhodocyclaceae bacterium]HMZ77849.1 M14-type cytosolic carboxypeptidase [Rhodocyclaceae bacterium]
MRISSNFDSGAIEVVSVDRADDIRLRLRADQGIEGDGAFRQWFHFRVHGGAGAALRMVFENASEAAYPDGWPGYRCVASYDRRNWFRVSGTHYVDGQLVVEHTPERDSVYYAYFEPYSHERHLDLLGWAEMSPYASVSNLGATVDGRDLDVVTVGRPGPGKQPVWITARQHPGESMAEWFVEGVLERLLDGADPVARKIREHAVLHIVPNMNPDGAFRGNLRTNAAGVNLNRAWREPDPLRSPEVHLVRQAMEASGVSLFLDIHGDEALPYVFFSTAEEVPGFSDAQRARQAEFVAAFEAASPDFQREHGYLPGRFAEELLTLASKWVAYRFGCVSLTLEMPFKDNALLPDGLTGWNGARSKRLGAAILGPILRHVSATGA